jgi:hypothetical protein
MKWWQSLLIGFGAPYVWIVTASGFYCNLAGKWSLFRFPFMQWIQAAPWWRLNWHMTFYVVAGALAPTIISLIILSGIISQQRTRRVRPNLYGETGFVTDHGTLQRGGVQLDKDIFAKENKTQ